jgi:hypothetical protein
MNEMDETTQEIETRFWNKVRKAGPNECWFWTGRIDRYGYGKFRLNSKEHGSHRISLKLSGVNIEGFFVLHQCDNPLCVNPNHLKAGTHKENMAEMKAKGRARNKYTVKKEEKVLPYHDKIHICECCGSRRRERIFTQTNNDPVNPQVVSNQQLKDE